MSKENSKMSEIEVKIRDDKAMLYTPYNPEFVKG